jgi:hypothetical protein
VDWKLELVLVPVSDVDRVRFSPSATRTAMAGWYKRSDGPSREHDRDDRELAAGEGESGHANFTRIG